MGDTYNFKNTQFGNGNIMINAKEYAAKVLQEKEWRELETFLKLRVDEVKAIQDISLVASEALEYVKTKDERGLKGFIKRNRESFFTNVLSDAVSSGLTIALTKLSF